MWFYLGIDSQNEFRRAESSTARIEGDNLVYVDVIMSEDDNYNYGIGRKLEMDVLTPIEYIKDIYYDNDRYPDFDPLKATNMRELLQLLIDTK